MCHLISLHILIGRFKTLFLVSCHGVTPTCCKMSAIFTFTVFISSALICGNVDKWMQLFTEFLPLFFLSLTQTTWHQLLHYDNFQHEQMVQHFRRNACTTDLRGAFAHNYPEDGWIETNLYLAWIPLWSCFFFATSWFTGAVNFRSMKMESEI